MQIQLPVHNRYLARKVICDGVEYGLSTISVKEGKAVVCKFEKETPSTVFVDGMIIVEQGLQGPVIVQII